MEAQTYKCPGCRQPISFGNVDFTTRRAHCEWCENDVVLPRQEIVGSEKVSQELKQAIRFFTEKDFEMAQKYAEDILSTSVDNAVGLFIRGYIRAFVNHLKNRDTINKLLGQTLIDIAGDMTDEELDGFKKCVLSVAPNIVEFEEQILAGLLTCDPEGIVAFTEQFSPMCIMKRTDIEWANENIFRIYKEIGSRGPIAKTWYALFSGVLTNPWSPYKAGFHLKTRTKAFYDNYVERIDALFNAIPDETLRAKFYGAFTNKKQDFVAKMNQI